jgi:serine/threonine-protein kinase
MASVFLSVVPGPIGFNKLLVIKVLREELSNDADFLAMFVNEARLAARLNHANVVQTYEVGVEGAHHFLVMDYLDGQPLHALLRKATRAGMPLDVHVRILAETLAGLHYAHTLAEYDGSPLHVVHRDVSPQNVFITYDGQVKVVDFGIAKAAGATTTTQSGVFKGKLTYVAPEQADGGHVDARAVVFSVGVMLWEAMAGQRFATGDGQAAMLGRRLSGTEPRIRDVVPDSDPELADICDKAIARDVEQRFTSAAEFHDALERFLDRYPRRVGAREVGAFISGLFVEERAKIRAIIDEQMRRVQRETSTQLPMPVLDVFPGGRDPTPITTIESRAAAERAAAALRASASGIPAVFDGAAADGISRSHATLVAAHISQAPPPARSTARAVLIALSVLAVGLLGTLLAVLFLRNPTPVVPVAAASSAPAAEKIKLTITYGPAGAVAKLDGAPLANNPFVVEVPRDRSMHRLEVDGPGFKPETRMVTYDQDALVAVALEAAPAPTATVDAQPEPPKLGKGKLKPGKASRGIDEKDPYKQ